MLTDASIYQPDGTIVAFEEKAFPVASWNGAISGRGNCWWATVLTIAEAQGSFDAFVAQSAPIIEREHKAAITRGELHGQTMIEVHVVGWSEREDRAKGYVLQSPNGLEDEFSRPRYVWCDHDDGEGGMFRCHQETIRENWILHRQGAEPGEDYDAGSFDPVRHGIPLMEMQRRGRADARLGPFAGMHVIGGHILLTVVDREGTRQGVIHEWPDVVGEPIRPAPLVEASLARKPPSWLGHVPFAQFEADLRAGVFDPETLELRKDVLARVRGQALVLTPAGVLSRQQRRAGKAQARKGRVHAA
jgi:hypothetical protein